MASFARGPAAASPSQTARKAIPQEQPINAPVHTTVQKPVVEISSAVPPAVPAGNMFEGMSTSAPSTPTPVVQAKPTPPSQSQTLPKSPVVAPAAASPVAPKSQPQTQTPAQTPTQAPVKATPTPVKVAPAKPPAPVEVCATIKDLASDVISQYELQARDLAAEYSYLGEEIRSMKVELEKEEIGGRMLQQRVEETEVEQAKLAEAEDFESADALSTEVTLLHMVVMIFSSAWHTYMSCASVCVYLMLHICGISAGETEK